MLLPDLRRDGVAEGAQQRFEGVSGNQRVADDAVPDHLAGIEDPLGIDARLERLQRFGSPGAQDLGRHLGVIEAGGVGPPAMLLRNPGDRQ